MINPWMQDANKTKKTRLVSKARVGPKVEADGTDQSLSNRPLVANAKVRLSVPRR